MMRNSRKIFLLHCFCLSLLVVGSLFAFKIKEWDKGFFTKVFFPIFVAVSALTLASWPLCGGCLLTRWEKQFLEREGLRPYNDPFIVHYLDQWVGVRVHPKIATGLVILLMLVPVVVFFR